MDENQTQPQEPMADGGDKPRAGREMLVQLQQMIDQVTSHAAPVARDIAAKAAELAAVAGEKAGPFAKRAAEKTEEVGARVADRSRRFAEELRNRVEVDEPAATSNGSANGSEQASETEAPPHEQPVG